MGLQRKAEKTVSKWEARLEATTEDVGSLFAPVLLQQTKDGDCTLQDLVNLWHEQIPFHCGFSDSTTTVCLQVNRFLILGVKTAQPFRWNRITIHLPCFMTEHSWTIRWKCFWDNFCRGSPRQWTPYWPLPGLPPHRRKQVFDRWLEQNTSLCSHTWLGTGPIPPLACWQWPSHECLEVFAPLQPVYAFSDKPSAMIRCRPGH